MKAQPHCLCPCERHSLPPASHPCPPPTPSLCQTTLLYVRAICDITVNVTKVAENQTVLATYPAVIRTSYKTIANYITTLQDNANLTHCLPLKFLQLIH